MPKLLSRWTYKHVAHEESMVCASTDNANVNSITFIPSSEAIDDVYPTPGVEVINRTFSVYFPYLGKDQHRDQKHVTVGR